MNYTHLHLLINHLPVFGTFLGFIILIYGMYAKSDATKTAAYLVFLIAGVGGAIAYYTGDPAEDTVKHLSGIVKGSVHEHEKGAFMNV